MKIIKLLIPFLFCLIFSNISYADDCSNNIQDFSVSDDVSATCKESLKNMDLLMGKVQKAFNDKSVFGITQRVSQLSNVAFVFLNSGDRFVDAVGYAISDFLGMFSFLGLALTILIVCGIIKTLFKYKIEGEDILKQLLKKVYQILISVGVGLTFIFMVSIASYMGYDNSITALYKMIMTSKKANQSVDNLKHEIQADAKYKADELLNDVLKSASCSYKRDKEIAFNSSFDGMTKYVGGDYQSCMFKNNDVQDNPIGTYNTKYFRQIRNCAMATSKINHISCGSINTKNNHADVSNYMDMIEPLLKDFAYKLDTYTCNNTKSIVNNYQHFIDGKNCVDYNPITHVFSLTDNGKPKLTDKVVTIEELNSLVKQIHYAILEGNVNSATKLVKEMKVDSGTITPWDLAKSLITDNFQIKAMKDKSEEAYDYTVNFVDFIEYNERQSKDKDTINTSSNELRTNQVIDELTVFAEGKDKGVDAAAKMIASVGGGGYLKSIGYNDNELYDFNITSTLYVSTLEFAKQTFTMSIITGGIGKFLEPFGSKSDSEIPNTTIIAAEQKIKLLAGFLFSISLFSMVICLFMFANVAKMIFSDTLSYFMLLVKAVTVIPFVIFIEVFTGSVSWQTGLIERLSLLLYIYLKPFLISFKIVLILIVISIVFGEFIQITGYLDGILGLFGKDSNSFSGILHNFVMAAIMTIMAAWVIARTMRTIEEQIPQLETSYSFGSASSMNYNMNGNAQKNAFNGYIKGGRA